jgi:hypothetical protein
VLISKSPYPIPCIERTDGPGGWARDIKWVGVSCAILRSPKPDFPSYPYRNAHDFHSQLLNALDLQSQSQSRPDPTRAALTLRQLAAPVQRRVPEQEPRGAWRGVMVGGGVTVSPWPCACSMLIALCIGNASPVLACVSRYITPLLSWSHTCLHARSRFQSNLGQAPPVCL